MAEKLSAEFTCDACKKTKAHAQGEALPQRWLHVSTDGFIDRTWDEHDVCPACIKKFVSEAMYKKTNGGTK